MEVESHLFLPFGFYSRPLLARRGCPRDVLVSSVLSPYSRSGKVVGSAHRGRGGTSDLRHPGIDVSCVRRPLGESERRRFESKNSRRSYGCFFSHLEIVTGSPRSTDVPRRTGGWVGRVGPESSDHTGVLSLGGTLCPGRSGYGTFPLARRVHT